MTIPPLPPEIKSAEEQLKEWAINDVGYEMKLSISDIKQRDLAIWNAAIEKAAELMKYRRDGVALGTSSERIRLQQAILNLKRKE
ncbi:MAG: hypothetical protein KGL39_22835 [Patescibacteria group bacterium]|nr:hypothetical protein [Patescibacteria group bacterium]